MNAVILSGIGAIDKLVYTSIPTPQPKADEASVKVEYCGINHLDLLIRQGKRPGIPAFPHILGSEIVGTIEKLHSNNDQFSTGGRVAIYPWTFCGKCTPCKSGNEQICDTGGTFGRTRWGGYTQYVTAPIKNLIKIPNMLPLDDVCAITLAGTTAHHLITRANITEKSTVLVTGATGGVGTIVIQLLKNKKCTVVCTTSSKKKINTLKKLGVDYVVSTETIGSDVKKIFPDGVDFAIDMMGGIVWSQALTTLSKNGTMVFCATTLDDPGIVNIGNAFSRQLNILGSYGGSRKDLKAALHLLKSGIIKPVIHSIYSLKDAPVAQQLLEKQKIFGKVLLSPAPSPTTSTS